MSCNWYLTHASVVTADEVLEDVAVRIEDGVIAAVDPTSGSGAAEINLDGRLLMPGIIDLHSDALEHYIAPRVGAIMPLPFGITNMDRQLAIAGVTTCYHATGFGGESLGTRGIKIASQISRTVMDYAPHALIDNRVHCRYEITEPDALPAIELLLRERQCALLSAMDHSPGQGQFVEVEAYREHLQVKRHMSETEVDQLLERMSDNAATAHDRVRQLAAIARECGVPLASHDDDCPEHVNRMHDLGAAIAEFPVQREAAAEAHRLGMSVMVGAPNILRGGSHNGNLRAADLIQEGWANCIASDYAPAAILASVFRLVDELGMSLPAATQLATLEPAQTVGLEDRGSIAVGKRADLIAVARVGEQPVVTRTWCNGKVAIGSKAYEA